jgi:hypothetical protein
VALFGTTDAGFRSLVQHSAYRNNGLAAEATEFAVRALSMLSTARTYATGAERHGGGGTGKEVLRDTA